MRSHQTAAVLDRAEAPVPRSGVLETYRPTENYENVAAIGVERVHELIEAGRTLFISDIDATAAANGSFEVSPETAEVYKAIADHPDATLVFWTNIKGRKEESLLRVQWIAETQGAMFATYCDAPDETKPSPAKIHAIINEVNRQKELELTTANTVMIGDKLTADVRAGNLARDNDPSVDGVHTIWVDRLGDASTDLWGDRWLRRPYEHLLWTLLGKKTQADLGATAVHEVVDDQEPRTYNRKKLPTRERAVQSPVLQDHSVIANIGNGPELRITDEKFATMPPPKTEPIYEALRSIQNSALMEWIEDRAKEHGKRDANIITLGRIIGIPIVIGALAMDKKKFATYAYAGLAITDVVDGFLAGIYKRNHPEEYANQHTPQVPQVDSLGPANTGYQEDKLWDKQLSFVENLQQVATRLLDYVKAAIDDPEWGPKWDPLADKYLANSAEVVFMLKHPELAPWILSIFMRDFLRERVQRPRFEARGFSREDLGATRSSKNSSFVLNAAVAGTMSSGSPRTRIALHAAAAGAKWFSHFGSVPIWNKRKQFREDAETAHTRLKQAHGILTGTESDG